MANGDVRDLPSCAHVCHAQPLALLRLLICIPNRECSQISEEKKHPLHTLSSQPPTLPSHLPISHSDSYWNPRESLLSLPPPRRSHLCFLSLWLPSWLQKAMSRARQNEQMKKTEKGGIEMGGAEEEDECFCAAKRACNEESRKGKPERSWWLCVGVRMCKRDKVRQKLGKSGSSFVKPLPPPHHSLLGPSARLAPADPRVHAVAVPHPPTCRRAPELTVLQKSSQKLWMWVYTPEGSFLQETDRGRVMWMIIIIYFGYIL